MRTWRKGNPCLWECELVQPLRKAVWKFLKKLKIELLYDPAILKKMKTLVQIDTCISTFIEALFTIDKIWKQPKFLRTDEWIKKMWYGEFPGGLVVRNWCLHCGSLGSISGQGTEILQATQHSQKKEDIYIYIHTHRHIYLYYGILLSHENK